MILPGIAAATTSPWSANKRRKPVTANSRQIIIANAQAGIILSTAKKIKAVKTNNLSASGSANLPKFVTKLFFRAI